MNDLCTDIGWRSLNKDGEQLCGDHVKIVDQGNDPLIAVLADGLGSGVKASILSTLTATIISTMTAAGMKIEDCVETIASTLPVCSVRGVAYSTFTLIKISGNREADIIQYDNPQVIMLRDGKKFEMPLVTMDIGGKKILKSHIVLQENDIIVALSDGAVHAGVGLAYNMGWQRNDIIDFIELLYDADYTAKTLSTMLLDQCNKLYDNKPGDDTTVCVLKIRRREQVNLMIGPPANRSDTNKMMSLFFSKQGHHIVCGGTTATIAAEYLHTTVRTNLEFCDPDIPPTGSMEGVDLVTEGVITINKVLTYAQNYLEDNESYKVWSYKKDGASQIARMLFEDATDINFYVGRAVNPAHQNPDLPINFSIKMRLVDELASCLSKMGKRIKVSYF